MTNPVTVAWISDFPIEWLPDRPEALRALPRRQPATWMSVLLAELESRREIRLHVVVLRKGLATDVTFRRNGVDFHVLRVPGGWRAPSLFWTDTIRIGRLLKRLNPHLVHAWGTERGAALVASRLGRPCVVTMQGIASWLRERVPLTAYERLVARLEDVSLRRARWVTTESVFAIDYLGRRFPHLGLRQVEHAPNWIFHRVERRPQLRPLRLLNVGTPGLTKGTDLLLQALGRLHGKIDFELVCVGAPNPAFLAPLRAELPAELWRRIEFKSSLTPAEIAEELARAVLFLLPTRADTSPNAVKEAAVAGVPVVASRVGGIPDYVTHEKNGLLFDAGDPGQLVEAIRAACVVPPFCHGRVDPATLESAREYLSPATMARKFLAVYREVLAGVS